jgi:hypothetical protein
MSTSNIPISARVHLGHAVVETIALDAGVDLLHIKGPALLPGLRRADRVSSDVDVLVAPAHYDRFEQALRAHGWDRRSDLRSGSAFHHASNWVHDNWGYVDVHALWPGPRVPASEVFAEFAAGDHRQEIAHFPCRVPNRTAQILILVLHAARSGGFVDDVDVVWRTLPEEEQNQVRAMAQRLQAGTAFAAGVGELETVAGDRTADLWRHYAHGGTRVDEWRARWRAAGTHRERWSVLSSVVLVNRDYLRMELGHAPSRREVAARQWRRARVLWLEIVSQVRERARRGDRS